MTTMPEAKVSLHKNGNFIIRVANYDLSYLGFHARSKFFTYEAKPTINNLQELKKEFNIVYTPQASDLRMQLVAEYKNILNAQKYKTMSELQIEEAWVAERIYEKLPAEPYQKRSILFGLAVQKAMLYLEMGLGKTYIGASLAQSLHDRNLIKPNSILLIAPLTLQEHENWPNELDKFSDLTHTIISTEADFQDTVDIYIMNSEKFRKFCVDDNGDYIDGNVIEQKEIDCIIFDESTKLKTHNSITTRCFLEFSKKVKFVYLMSGLPAPNSVFQLWSQAASVGYWLGDNYGPFLTRYGHEKACGAYSRFFPKHNAEEEIKKRIELNSIFMKSEDHLNLPPYDVDFVEIQMPQEMDTLYQKIEHDYMVTINALTTKMSGQDRKMYFIHEASVRAKMLQTLCGFILDSENPDPESRVVRLTWNPKLDKLVEHLKAILADETNNVIIWTRFRAELDELYETLSQKWVCAYGKGGMNKSERRAQLDLWLKSKHCRIMIAHPGAFMYGHTWNKANYTIFSSAVEDNEHYSQARKRNHRRGQTRAVHEYRYVFSGTLEKQIWKSIEHKIRLDKFLKRGL